MGIWVTAEQLVKKIAAENGISKNTVLRAEQFSKGVDAAEEAVPGTRKKSAFRRGQTYRL